MKNLLLFYFGFVSVTIKSVSVVVTAFSFPKTKVSTGSITTATTRRNGLRMTQQNKNDEITTTQTLETSQELSSSSSNSSTNKNPKNNLQKKVKQLTSERFGTRAKNVGRTMSIDDVIVPLCSNLAQRQILANRGIYPGVEYKLTSLQQQLTDGNSKSITSMEELTPDEQQSNKVTAYIQPIYPLRSHLERTDWPVPVHPINDVPLWISDTTYAAGTALGTLALSLSYLSIAAIVAFFVRFVYVPSESMIPTLNPGNVVLVTRQPKSIVIPTLDRFLGPRVGDVILFDPPSELETLVSDMVIGTTLGMDEDEDVVSTIQKPEKGQRFLKRVIATPGEFVGVKNSNPYVTLLPDDPKTTSTKTTTSSSSSSSTEQEEQSKRKFRVDIIGPYAHPEFFIETSWDRNPIQLSLQTNEYFVTGDNGFHSVDSRVWGPLKGKNIFGKVQWIIWPLNDFGPVKDGNIFTVEK